MLSYGLERFEHYEWANICKMSYVPYYIAVIFEAHYYELSSNVKHTETCEDNKINLLYQWYIIELRVFYGYIIGGVMFIVMCQLLRIDKERRHKPNDALTGVEGDFLEKYSSA